VTTPASQYLQDEYDLSSALSTAKQYIAESGLVQNNSCMYLARPVNGAVFFTNGNLLRQWGPGRSSRCTSVRVRSC